MCALYFRYFALYGVFNGVERGAAALRERRRHGVDNFLPRGRLVLGVHESFERGVCVVLRRKQQLVVHALAVLQQLAQTVVDAFLPGYIPVRSRELTARVCAPLLCELVCILAVAYCDAAVDGVSHSGAALALSREVTVTEALVAAPVYARVLKERARDQVYKRALAGLVPAVDDVHAVFEFHVQISRAGERITGYPVYSHFFPSPSDLSSS